MKTTAVPSASASPRMNRGSSRKPAPGQGSGKWNRASMARMTSARTESEMVLRRDRTVADTVTGARISTAKGFPSPPVR